MNPSHKLSVITLLHSPSCSDSFRVTAVESTEIGGAIGRVKADDPDVGRNAEMEYSIVGGHDIFNIITDQTTQEGVIIIKKVALLLLWSTLQTQTLQSETSIGHSYC